MKPSGIYRATQIRTAARAHRPSASASGFSIIAKAKENCSMKPILAKSEA